MVWELFKFYVNHCIRMAETAAYDSMTQWADGNGFLYSYDNYPGCYKMASKQDDPFWNGKRRLVFNLHFEPYGLYRVQFIAPIPILSTDIIGNDIGKVLERVRVLILQSKGVSVLPTGGCTVSHQICELLHARIDALERRHLRQ